MRPSAQWCFVPDPEGKRRKKQKHGAGLPSHVESLNSNAAGIDIGSREHYVAVPEGRAEQSVSSFGCFAPDLHMMARWLKECGIETVALESTGVYWIPVVEILEEYGFEVLLVDARYVKNVPGRKTDVLDCQWLQQLHTFGLLRGAFRPTLDIAVLRSYWRQRAVHVQAAARQIQLMQKGLEQMNLQLHKVLTDITGVTGMKIIRAILAGERDPLELAKHRYHGVKCNEETVAKALIGNYREEHLFALRQAVELYDIYQAKLLDCNDMIQAQLSQFESKATQKLKKTRKRRRKNNPAFDLAGEMHRMTGVDLTIIDGIDALTAFTVITEVGIDMSKFKTEKHLASYLCLCPNNRITGGKVHRSRSRKTRNRATTARRVAAQTLQRSQTALGAFFRRMKGRHGAPKAITATARKLALNIYRMLKYGEEYVDAGLDYYEPQYEERLLGSMKRRANKMGYTLVPVENEGGVS